jgi:DUF1707 SHOCT-like domain
MVFVAGQGPVRPGGRPRLSRADPRRGYNRLVALVSSTEREGTATALRRHYVNGRLTLDEFSDRMRLTLAARRGWELRRALWGLPPVWRDVDELQRIGRAVKRRLVMAIIVFLWVVASFVVMLSFALGAVLHGTTTTDVVGYTAAWLLVSALALLAHRRA